MKYKIQTKHGEMEFQENEHLPSNTVAAIMPDGFYVYYIAAEELYFIKAPVLKYEDGKTIRTFGQPELIGKGKQ